jgi:hypothetical protein
LGSLIYLLSKDKIRYERDKKSLAYLLEIYGSVFCPLSSVCLFTMRDTIVHARGSGVGTSEGLTQLCACSSVQPPHWMPDGAKPYCSHCLEDFDALNRRRPM